MFRPEVVRPSEHRLVLRYTKLAAALRAPITKIAERWREGEEFVFDSIAGTLTYAGKPAGKVDRVVLSVFRPDKERHHYFRVKLLLPDGSKLEAVASSSEKYVTGIAEQIARFLGKHLDIEYRGGRHGHPIQSLNLSERELEDSK